MDQILDFTNKYQDLNNKFEESSHPEKLETLNNLLNVAKKNEKSILTAENEQTLKKVLKVLLDQLDLMTGKDIIRKLLIKCVNILTKLNSEGIFSFVQHHLVRLLNDHEKCVGQRLFVLGIYMENIDLGVDCLVDLKYQCLGLFSSWLIEEHKNLKESTAPINASKHVQNIQLLFKTFVYFLQKCFDPKLTSQEHEKCSREFECLSSLISGLFDDSKDSFNMELAYLASMAQISIKLVQIGNNNLTELIESCLRKYQENQNCSIDLRDLCLFQAILTIAKAPQIQQEAKGIDLFKKILVIILKREILNKNETLLEQVSRNDDDYDWFSNLIIFVWSKFDSNVDVVKNTNLQNYKILLSIANKIKKNQVEAFYDEEVNKCMSTSWQSNSKLNALIILLASGLSASKIYTNHSSIAFDLMGSISERSTACLVADLYSNLFKTHREEILAKKGDLNSWARIWWLPIETVLESNEKLKKTYTYEYLLPKMMRQCPDGVLACEPVSKSYASKLIFAKVNRSLGLKEGASWWETMEQAVVHFDDQVRLDAFGLLCDNQKSTVVVADDEFKLIKHFLNFNSDSYSPSFRQIVISHLKKLFYRMKESWLFQVRQLGKEAENDFETVNNSYQSFIEWIFEFLFSSLHLDSTFAKRNQSLTVMTTFVEIIGCKCPVDQNKFAFFNFAHLVQRDRLFSLIQCLWDTFEANKDMSLNLLEKLDKQIFEKNGVLAVDYFNVSIELLSSRRPIDSITSVYLMVFIQKKFHLNDVCASTDKSLSLFLVKSCLNELDSHLKLAQTNLLLAALNKPIYGPLSSIRNLLIHSVTEIKDSGLVAEWREIITRLIEMCFEISRIVSPIVNSSSPEGIFPKELRSAEPNSEERAVTPQMLLVCCWRTMKEVSLFFGDLVRLLPIELESQSYLLTHQQVTQIGEFFVKLLFEARHLGVFEQTYLGFMSMCETFWKSNSDVYFQQPTKWLDHILNAIQEESFRSKLCSTRRGGGLPCFVQAIVSTELVDFGRKSLKKSMKILLDLAETDYNNDEKNFTKVLAMFILSALFKDTRLGENVLEHAERALITAINGFDSIYWNIRNASTLLFSSLINRIFGVNRSKEDISKKNSMIGKSFFSKFPRLYAFFDQIISDSNVSINTHLNPKLYLVALIMGHLFTLSDELADPEACLHSYVPSLLKSLKCPVMKTRIYVAKAVVAIVNLSRYPSLLKDIFSMLLGATDNNSINGLLLVLNKFLEKTALFKYMPADRFLDRIQQLSRFDHCPVNLTLILGVLNKCRGFIDSVGKSVLDQMWVQVAHKALTATKTHELNLKPGAQDLLVALGESICVLAANPSAGPLISLLGEMIPTNREYSIHLMKGVVQYFRQAGDEIDEGPNLTILIGLFRQRAIRSVIEWDSINNIHDLKWSCEILAIFFRKTIEGSRDDRINNNHGLFTTQPDLYEFWKNLVDCARNQIETDTRITVLGLITHVFRSVFENANINQLYLDKLVDVLETYLDQDDESIILSQFLDQNYQILCSPDKLGSSSIKLWDLLIALLVDQSKDSSLTACDIIARIMAQMTGQNTNELKKTPMAMIRPTVILFVRLHQEKFPLDTARFLLQQFVIFSECDSNPNTGEEELETVFDKGVDSIHSSELVYLNELLEVLGQTFDCTEHREIYRHYSEIIRERLGNELKYFDCSQMKMKYNDVKLSKIATNVMFLKRFSSQLGDFKLDDEKIFSRLNKSALNVNSFLNRFLK